MPQPQPQRAAPAAWAAAGLRGEHQQAASLRGAAAVHQQAQAQALQLQGMGPLAAGQLAVQARGAAQAAAQGLLVGQAGAGSPSELHGQRQRKYQGWHRGTLGTLHLRLLHCQAAAGQLVLQPSAASPSPAQPQPLHRLQQRPTPQTSHLQWLQPMQPPLPLLP